MSDGRATSNIWRNIARIELALLIGFFVGLAIGFWTSS